MEIGKRLEMRLPGSGPEKALLRAPAEALANEHVIRVQGLELRPVAVASFSGVFCFLCFRCCWASQGNRSWAGLEDVAV